MFQEAGFLPTVESVYQDEQPANEKSELVFYKELLNNGLHRPAYVEYTKISDILSYYINLAIQKEISISTALESATNSINSNQVLLK